MKRRFFSTLLLAVFFLFALNLKGDISWKSDPVITSFPSTFTKYVDIVSGESSWYHEGPGGIATVYVSADLKGVGKGVATLKNVSLMGKGPYVTWGGEPTDVGTMNTDGSWTSGEENVSVGKPAEIPEDAEDGDSWSWSAGAESGITPTPWGWRVSTSQGWTISFPLGLSGRYTTTGSWQAGTSLPPRTALARSGTHTLDIQYKCSACQQSGDTPAAIGGREAHVEGECPGSNCSVRYRKCTPPDGHKIHDACGNRHCDGQDHSYVSLCTSHVSSDPANTYTGCNQKIYKCTESGHSIVSGQCGHKYRACTKGDHDTLETSCSTDSNCISTNFYKCQHTQHEYSANEGTQGSGICPECGKAH